MDIILAVLEKFGIIVLWKGLTSCFKRKGNKPNLLFVDDDVDDFEIVKSLQKNHYTVDTLKDIEDLECDHVKKAKIIFIDFKGVGKKFGDKQGIDLIKALKDKYKRRKTIILFSAHKFPLVREYTDSGDDIIKKNASLREFLEMIEKYS